MNQGLVCCPGEERIDDICVDDIRKGVELPREPVNVIPQGLIGLLLATLEVLRIPEMDVHPLEVPYEDPLEVRLVVDVVV